ncbi:MAG: hypothetical protein RL354_2383 [Planctomycetota bacterium]|jgi:DNA-directed RNA polymerase specialized sigma24 family protein
MRASVPDDFTVLLNRAAVGDGDAANTVWSRSYAELEAIARSVRPVHRGDSIHAPSPTTIIHESFVKTFGPNAGDSRGERPAWDSRAHFFGSVVRAMSQFVIDWRRSATRRKRGGGQRPVAYDEATEAQCPRRAGGDSADALFSEELAPVIAEALARLHKRAPELADVVWLRCVAGLSLEDTALLLGIRPRTVSKRWNLGRALLRRDLAHLAPSEPARD